MYPGMMHWLRMRRHGHCGEGAHAGPGGQGHGPGGHGGPGGGPGGWHGHHEGWQAGGWGQGGDDFGGGAFGVRRPLRFLAFKLNLSEQQVGELAKILDELKTERAQAAVDDRRTTAAFADAIGLEQFNADKANEGGALRVLSAEKLRNAVVKALGRIHALLDQQQRTQLAYLVRTGVLSI